MSFKSVSEVLNTPSGKLIKELSPIISLTLVQVGDVGTSDYVVGSEGQVKTLTEYRDYDKTIILSITTFKYEDSAYPTKATEIRGEVV